MLVLNSLLWPSSLSTGLCITGHLPLVEEAAPRNVGVICRDARGRANGGNEQAGNAEGRGYLNGSKRQEQTSKSSTSRSAKRARSTALMLGGTTLDASMDVRWTEMD